MDEDKLIEKLKKGSDDAMKELMQCYGGLVKYIVVQILGSQNEKDIEECISDVFLNTWVNIKSFDKGKGSLKNYIVAIARNRVINQYRSMVKDYERKIPLEEDTILIQDTNTEEEVLREINHKLINEVIDEMEEPDRSIFIRRYFWFQKVKDIASALNVTPKFIENKLHRNKEKLKHRFNQKGVNL